MQTTLLEQTPDEILDKKGAAHYLKIGPRTLDSYMQRRLLPYFRIGGKTIRFKRSDLDVALEKFRVS